MTIDGGAVTATAKNSSGDDSIAIKVNDFTVNGDSVTATSGNASGSSIGILTEKSSAAAKDGNFTIQPKANLKAGTYKAKVTFSFSLVDTTEEYSKTSTVTFKVVDPASTDSSADTNSKTGDDSNMILFIVVACVALAGAGGAAFAFRRKVKSS